MHQIEQLFIEETLLNNNNNNLSSSSSSSTISLNQQQQIPLLSRSVDLYKKWKSIADEHSSSFTTERLQVYLTQAENFFFSGTTTTTNINAQLTNVVATGSGNSGNSGDGGSAKQIDR